ncbi:FtsX-like permease family protein [uncultured Duncaniella sp.]|uniref:ABC transporter permease n=1 Tax=uncultured Duncaniella sp. TaxID=2768039 RepID=UPI00321FCB84
MVKHYIKVAFRNLAKYKTQNIISIISIGVSVAIFAIVSMFMLNINSDPLLEQDYVDNVAIMYISTNSDRTSGDISSYNISSHQFKTVEKVFLPASQKKSMTVCSDNADPIAAIAVHVDREFLQWCAYKSALSEKLVENIDNHKVIISQNLGNKLFGDYKSAIGRQIKVEYADEINSDTRTFQIADVIEQFQINDSKFPNNVDIFYSADFGGGYEVIKAYLLIRPGKMLKDVVDELALYLGVPESNIYAWQYRAWEEKNNLMAIIISRAIMFFLYLFVIVSLSSALRQWLQLFTMRQREIAIRKSLGSKNIHILRLLVTEELISIISAFIFTTICCILAISFLENNFQEAINTLNFDRVTIFILSLCCYLSIMGICLIADWYTIKQITSNKHGLALQMKPKKHRLRNIGVCLQIVTCIIFLSVTTVFALGFNSMERQLGIPSDKSRYERGLMIQADRISESQTLQIAEELKHIESVEQVINVMTASISIEYADSTRDFARAYFQRGNDVVNFYDMNINYLTSQQTLQRYVLISQQIKEKMIETGEWSTEKIMIDATQYDIAGWFDQMPFWGMPSVIMVDSSKDNNYKCHFYILPQEGMEAEAKHDIKELIAKIAPERLDAYPQNLSFELLGQYKAVTSIGAIVYIMLGISMITTVATIYAAISLDTRRRRKEMALRKINGAKSKDICRIFAKIYLIIVGVSILIAVPISWIIIVALNETFNFEASPLITSCIAVLACLGAIFLTLYWKIKDVMNVDPVTYLKD